MRTLRTGDRIKTQHGVTWEILENGHGVVVEENGGVGPNIGYITPREFYQSDRHIYLGNFSKSRNFNNLYELLKD